MTNYVSRKDVQLALFQAGGRPPALNEAYNEVAKADPDVQGFHEAGKGGKAMPNIPAMNSVWGPLGQAAADVISGKADGGRPLRRRPEGDRRQHQQGLTPAPGWPAAAARPAEPAPVTLAGHLQSTHHPAPQSQEAPMAQTTSRPSTRPAPGRRCNATPWATDPEVGAHRGRRRHRRCTSSSACSPRGCGWPWWASAFVADGDPRRLRHAPRRPAEVPRAGAAVPAFLQMWPIVYTVGHGVHQLRRRPLGQQAGARSTDIIANSVREVPGTPRYKLSVAVEAGRRPRHRRRRCSCSPTPRADVRRRRQGPRGPARRRRGEEPIGKITAAPGYTILNARQVNARTRTSTRSRSRPPDGGGIKRGRPERGVRGQADRLLRQGAPTR